MPAPSSLRLPGASHLPPGMVLLMSGRQMTVEQFFRVHGAELSKFPDAQIVVAMPAYQPSAEVRDALKGLVGGVTAMLVGLLMKNANAARIASGAVSGYIAIDVADWVSHMLAHGSSVHVLTVRDIMGTGIMADRIASNGVGKRRG